jgi:hypothetical protein
MQFNYDKETGLFDPNSSLSMLQWQQIFGNRLRLNQVKTSKNLTLFNNKRVRVSAHQGRIGFQFLQPNIGWSPFKTIGKHTTIINSLDSFDTMDDTFIISAAEDGSIDAFLGSIIPNAIMLPLGLYLIYRASSDKSIFNFDKISYPFRLFLKKISSIKFLLNKKHE